MDFDYEFCKKVYREELTWLIRLLLLLLVVVVVVVVVVFILLSLSSE